MHSLGQSSALESSEIVAEGALGSLHSYQVANASTIPLKQKEEIAKAAYKTWFRIKPGHKEIKDHWWALYYRKVLPKYHLRDNHLGRKINAWIEEDLQLYFHQNPEASSKLDSLEEDRPTKKKKANSSKEGTVPAYVNVELVHPPKLDPSDFPPHMFLLLTSVVQHDLEWSTESLEADIHWFRENRNKIMEAVPPVTVRAKRSSGGMKKKLRDIEPQSPLSDDETDASTLESHPYFICNVPWLRCDLLKSDEAYWLKVDLPGLAPGTDFFVQTDDIHKLVVKGDRKADPERQELLPVSPILQQRPSGPFVLELLLPLSADLAKTEQTFHNGVLTVKCPIKDHQWRNMSEEDLGH